MFLRAFWREQWAQSPSQRVRSTQGGRQGAATHPLVWAGVGTWAWAQPPRQRVHSIQGGHPGCCYPPFCGIHRLSPQERRSAAHKGGPGCCYPPTGGVCGLSPLGRGSAAPKWGARMLLPALQWGLWAQPFSQRVHSTQVGEPGCYYLSSGGDSRHSPLSRGSPETKGRDQGSATHRLAGAFGSAP